MTHPRVFDPPSELDVVVEDLASLLDSPSLTLLGEGPSHPGHMRHALEAGGARGNLAPDAHIVALCREHGVRELLSADKDFGRFRGLTTRDPFSE